MGTCGEATSGVSWRRFQLGLWPGMALSAVDTVLLRGKAPWTLHHRCEGGCCAFSRLKTCCQDHLSLRDTTEIP